MFAICILRLARNSAGIMFGSRMRKMYEDRVKHFDHAPLHLPRALDLAQHVLAATGEELISVSRCEPTVVSVMSRPTD